MSVFRTWLFGIVAAAMVLSILYALLPKGALLTVARCTGGLIMLLVVIRPLLALDLTGVHTDYEAWQRTIQQQTDDYADANRQEMAAIIQQETAAYISEKAAALGLTCCPPAARRRKQPRSLSTCRRGTLWRRRSSGWSRCWAASGAWARCR